MGDTAYFAPVAGLEAADALRGRGVYRARCMGCHGADGRGGGLEAASLDPRPSDLASAEEISSYSDAGRVYVIENGLPSTAMPGFSEVLTRREVVDVYAYVLEMRGGCSCSGAGTRGSTLVGVPILVLLGWSTRWRR